MGFSFYHKIPLWLDFVLFIVVLLVALEVGFRIGLLRRVRSKEELEAAGGRISLNSMFAVLGLMLAFTFGATLTRHETRKAALIDEANALGTAFLRASLVEEPGRAELRNALLEFGETRVVERGQGISAEELDVILSKSWDAKGKLWPITERIVRNSERGPVEVALLDAVNEVLDSETRRAAAVFDSLPEVVLTLLLLIAAATVAVTGYNAGLSGRMSRWRTTILMIVMTSIVMVILDFDRPLVGFIHVRDDSIRSAVGEMRETLAEEGVGLSE